MCPQGRRRGPSQPVRAAASDPTTPPPCLSSPGPWCPAPLAGPSPLHWTQRSSASSEGRCCPALDLRLACSTARQAPSHGHRNTSKPKLLVLPAQIHPPRVTLRINSADGSSFCYCSGQMSLRACRRSLTPSSSRQPTSLPDTPEPTVTQRPAPRPGTRPLAHPLRPPPPWPSGRTPHQRAGKVRTHRALEASLTRPSPTSPRQPSTPAAHVVSGLMAPPRSPVQPCSEALAGCPCSRHTLPEAFPGRRKRPVLGGPPGRSRPCGAQPSPCSCCHPQVSLLSLCTSRAPAFHLVQAQSLWGSPMSEWSKF